SGRISAQEETSVFSSDEGHWVRALATCTPIFFSSLLLVVESEALVSTRHVSPSKPATAPAAATLAGMAPLSRANRSVFRSGNFRIMMVSNPGKRIGVARGGRAGATAP